MSPEEFVDEINTAYVRTYKRDEFTETIFKGIKSFMGAGHDAFNLLPPEVIAVKDKSRAGFPLGFGLYSKYVSQGAALIGDAAHRVHPLAGQGVNLGFGDVKTLVEVLGNAVYSGSNVGDLNHLLNYEKTRLQHNIPVMLGIHGIQQLFHTSLTPMVVARGLGFQLTNKMPFLKVF